ncbi:MAG TPA: PilT/PilU family type 4a pilus ATPase [Actinomycetota bacterium]
MEAWELLRTMVEMGGSDLHLKVGAVPFVRVDGTLTPTEFPALGPQDTELFAAELLPPSKASEFGDTSEADFGYTLPGVGRFRVNCFRQRGAVGLAIRRVRAETPTFEELMLPPVVRSLAEAPRGLVLVTGPTGTGKTTTIASFIGHINMTRRAHIVTVEDPIEVIHEDYRSIIDQREVGVDTQSYSAALRHVVRQDPDVIFVGEIRDQESAEAAIHAAETGHLVISTLHTIDATETVNRLIDLFPPGQQRQARVSLASGLRGVLSQRLLPRANHRGRVPAVEVLINNGRVQERLLKPESTFEIIDVIAEGEFYGMQTFDQSLVKLVMEGLVREEDAMEASSNPHDFQLAMKSARLRADVVAASRPTGDGPIPIGEVPGVTV